MAKCSSAQKSFMDGWEGAGGRGSRVFISLYKRGGLGFGLGLGLSIQFVGPDDVMVMFSSPIE